MSYTFERRRPALAPEMLLRVALVWALASIILLGAAWPSIMAMDYPGAGDLERLAHLRAFLFGDGDVAFAWADLPLAIPVLLFTPLLGQSGAEAVAGVAVPLAVLGASLLLAGRIAWRLVGDEACGLACLALALSVPVIAQTAPLAIEHIGLLVVLALAAMNSLMGRSAIVGGWAGGAALALWLAISFDGWPVALAIGVVAALRWLRSRHDSDWLAHGLTALAVFSAIFVLIARGEGMFAPFCGAVGPAHLAAFAGAAGGAWLLRWLEPLPRPAIALCIGLFVLAGGAAIWAFSGSCAAGAPGAGALWRQTPGTVLQVALPPFIGLLAALRLGGRSAAWLSRWWYDYALVLACALVLSVFAVELAALAGALAAVPLGWQIRDWIRSARRMRRPARRALALAAMSLALLPAAPFLLVAFA